MTKVNFRKNYRYDIALEDGIGAHLVAWVTGVMVFFVTLALAANLSLGSLANTWVSDLSGTLTVELKPQKTGEIPQKIAQLAKKHPAVEEARILPRDEILSLVEPWLGSRLAEDLPLPALVDLKLSANADIDTLKKDILAIAPQAVIEAHTGVLSGIRTLVNAGRLFVILLTGVILALAIAAISGIVRAKLAAHQQEIETLHLIGAEDQYIARQFQNHIWRRTLTGAGVGVIATLSTLFLTGYIVLSNSDGLFSPPQLPLAEWAALIVLPVLISSAVAHLTAYMTVSREIAKLP